MTISPEAKEAATAELLAYDHPSIYDTHERGHYVQLAINSATAPAVQSAKDSAANFRKSEVKRIEAEREVTNLQKEIERLRGEVSKAYHEGMIDYSTEGEEFHCVAEPLWNNSRAKRVAEGKE